MYPRPIIAKRGQECRISDYRSTSIHTSAASHQNWGAVTPKYPPSDLQILDTSGIVGSRDHTRLRAHSVINNRTGQSSGEGPNTCSMLLFTDIRHPYTSKIRKNCLDPPQHILYQWLIETDKRKLQNLQEYFVQWHNS